MKCRCKPEVSTASKFQPYPGLQLTQKAIELGQITPGEYEDRLPDNFHWISILKWDNRKDVERMNNLLNLFTFGTYFTFLKPLVYLFVMLPNSKFHHHIDNIAWKVITHRKDEEIISRKRIKLKVFIKFVFYFFHPAEIRATLRRNITHQMTVEEKKVCS